jgi:site-specific recombinase XerD
VNAHHSATLALNHEQARDLIAAADNDRGPQRLRNRALLRLLVHNALRVDEAINANRADLGRYPGRAQTHITLAVRRKGGTCSVIALAPSTVAALDRYHASDVTAADARYPYPLLATRAGRRLTQKAIWELVRRVPRDAGIECWARLSPHSLRHTSITLALDAGAPLRDVQDFAGHRDARTTRRYDRSRESLDRSPTYAVARWLDDE